MKQMNTAARRLERSLEKDRRDAEIRLAHEIMQANPELTYGEALRHAFAKLRREAQSA